MYGTKLLEYKAKDWHYCYFWFKKDKLCFLGKKNCYYETGEKSEEKNECDKYPYGRHSHCIGWCMKKILGKDGDDSNGI